MKMFITSCMLSQQQENHLRDPMLWFTKVMLVDAKEIQILHVPGRETPQLTEEDLRHVDSFYNFVRIMQTLPKSPAKIG